MESQSLVIQQIADTVGRLPVNKAIEVLDFAQYLLSKKTTNDFDEKQAAYLDPARNPLLEYAGGASVGDLSANIDDIAYDL